MKIVTGITGYSCEEYTGCLRENFTACKVDSPNIRNPMGNLIRTEIEFGRSKNREYPIPASR